MGSGNTSTVLDRYEAVISTVAPAVPLTEYQRAWVLDTSRFKIAVITRQGGKSFGTSLEAVLDCFEHKTNWVFLSAGERQSKELMGKAAQHARAIGLAVTEIESDYKVEDTTYKMLEIVFPNGSRIVGLPANPDTARGWSANILLDEFALHRDSREIWRAMFPTVTRGYKIRIISTYKGKSNKFYEIMSSAPTLQRFTGEQHVFVGDRGGWSKHDYTIVDACRMGLSLKDDEGKPIEPEDLRLALNDDDAWDEEYMNIPSDEVSAFLTHELISSVEGIRIVKEPAWVEQLIARAMEEYERFKRTQIHPASMRLDVLDNIVFLGDLYGGFDVARKRDLSVIWLDQLVGNVLRSTAVIELKKLPFFVQEMVLHTILGHRQCRRICIDETGIGAQLAENAMTMYSSKAEGITFTAQNKEILAIGLKNNFEDHASEIPADNTIRSSLHSVKKYETTTKHFRFDAERTEATGHADHFWAKALSVHAAETPYSKPEYETAEKRAFGGVRGAIQ